jgi:Ca2+-binding RTX toxin-like protein
VVGGDGDDLYLFGVGDTLVELAGGGTDTVESLVSVTLADELEILQLLGQAAINGTGSAGANTLNGNGGANLLRGLAGADTLFGSGGNDTLVGGDGADQLDGSIGFDVFRYANAGEGGDAILGFRATDDGFEISAAGFGGGLFAGIDLGATGRFLANRTGKANAPQGTGQFVFETDTDTLRWDADGRGGLAGVIIATIDGGIPTAADFVIIG